LGDSPPDLHDLRPWFTLYTVEPLDLLTSGQSSIIIPSPLLVQRVDCLYVTSLLLGAD